jgi:hypothetical protein
MPDITREDGATTQRDLNATINRITRTTERVVAERDEARAQLEKARRALHRISFMWDRETCEGYPFLHRSQLVPELRQILEEGLVDE